MFKKLVNPQDVTSKGAFAAADQNYPNVVNIRVWNGSGSVNFRPWGEKDGPAANSLTVNVTNRSGEIQFEPLRQQARSGYGTRSKILNIVFLGTITWYWREELKIIGRGVMAGMKLAIEKWEEKVAKKAEGSEN